MDFKNVANMIIKSIGGEKNVEYVTHCMSRLRFVLKDESKADDTAVERIKGVKGLMKQGGQYQIIIGGEVANVFNALPTNIKSSSSNNEIKSQNKNIKYYFNTIFDYISGSLTAALPAIIGCGMVKLLLVILAQLKLDGNSTYQVLNIIGETGFYFLPIIIAYTSAKKLNTDVILSMVVSAILVHPALIEAMAGDGLSFLGIPIHSTSYSAAVIPPLFGSALVKFTLPLVDKVTPGWTNAIFKPLLTLLICIPIMLIALAPLGAFIGDGLTSVTAILQDFSPWLTMTVLSALMPLLIITGMHHAFDPIMFANFAGPGYDGLFLPIMLATNFALGAACLAVGIKSRDKEFKSVAFSSAISASIAGITEPGLFAVLLRLKRPLIGAMIGSAAAGLFVGIFNVTSHALASPGALSMIQFISPVNDSNFTNAIIVAIISTVVGFISAYVLGFKDVNENEEINDTKDLQKEVVQSPIKGELMPITSVSDATFSKKLLGEGVAIIPSEGKVYAPFDGVIKIMFKTGHAIGLESETGLEMLIHVGIDTVKMEGKGFNIIVKEGDKVKKGDLLLEFDIDLIKKHNYEVTTPIILTNLQATGRQLTILQDVGAVDNSNAIFEIK